MDINALNKIKTHYNFNPSNILDIGANDGYFANLCRTIWPTSNLTLVEANPFWSDILKEKNYKNIITLLGNEKIFYGHESKDNREIDYDRVDKIEEKII